MATFNSLPPELILSIAHYLPPKFLAHLSQANTRNNKVLHTALQKAARLHAFADDIYYENYTYFDRVTGEISFDPHWNYNISRQPIVTAIERDNVDAVRGYLAAGIDVNTYSATGNRLLYSAAQEKAQAVSQFLLDNGADVNLQNLCSENTPLLMAAACGDDANVRRLIGAGADVQAHNIIHAICQSCALDSLQLAIAHGADLQQPSTRGASVIHNAVLNPCTDILRFLVTAVPELVNHADNDNKTALWSAASTERYNALRILVDAGINISHRNNLNETVLHSMMYSLARTDIPQFLLERGIEVNFAGQNGWTELHYAAETGSVDVVRALLERGLDPNAHDNQAQTPLHCAAKRNFLGVARVLIEDGGAVLNHVDAHGRTPVNVARVRGAFDTWCYLDAVFKECMMPW